MWIRPRFTNALVAVALPCIHGCGPARVVVDMLNPVVINVKVWVVLAQGGLYNDPGIEEESTAPQNRTNRGSRFTESEMRDRLALLQQHASIWGNVVFLWDGEINVAQWPELALLPSVEGDRPHQTELAFTTQVVWREYEEDDLNIYFVGWVSPNQNTVIWGYTQKPYGTAVPFIQLNDGGHWLGQGFMFANPDESLGLFTLEHEVTHYFARFFDNCYPRPDGPRCYNYQGLEHVAPGENNILSHLGPLQTTRPLTLHGRFDDISTEKGEIWNRLRLGGWNYP